MFRDHPCMHQTLNSMYLEVHVPTGTCTGSLAAAKMTVAEMTMHDAKKKSQGMGDGRTRFPENKRQRANRMGGFPSASSINNLPPTLVSGLHRKKRGCQPYQCIEDHCIAGPTSSRVKICVFRWHARSSLRPVRSWWRYRHQ